MWQRIWTTGRYGWHEVSEEFVNHQLYTKEGKETLRLLKESPGRIVRLSRCSLIRWKE